MPDRDDLKPTPEPRFEWWNEEKQPRRSREDFDSLRCHCGKPACEEPMRINCAKHRDGAFTIRYYGGALALCCLECNKIGFVVTVHREPAPLSDMAFMAEGMRRFGKRWLEMIRS